MLMGSCESRRYSGTPQITVQPSGGVVELTKQNTGERRFLEIPNICQLSLLQASIVKLCQSLLLTAYHYLEHKFLALILT